MKFVPSPFADGLSGSSGSLVASHNRAGPYFRRRAIPTNPNTIRQQAVRSIFGSLVNYWTNDLTQAERDLWEAYGANTPISTPAGPIFNTGQNWFVGNNTSRLQAGLSRVDNAPTVFDTGAPVTSVQGITIATLNAIGIDEVSDSMDTRINIASGASGDGDLLIFLGPPVNLTRNFYKGPYQLAAVLEVTDDDTEEDWTANPSSVESNNGVPAVGQYRGFRARIAYDDGRLSQPYEALLPVFDTSA